ncbi:hypothetical protein [Sphingomicrobium arenosum]|uniref:hypothetical protein n=1 Tax=Sphingomicrobium arenosum TaxID=2233861 RepID=UPI00224047C7|nr:hypothetical protein [Sphingomicrobium arenosum]
MQAQADFVARLALDPIPEPRAKVKWLMYATTMLVDGHVDLEPQHWFPYLENSFFLGEANLVIIGTGCQRPLVLREAMAVAAAVTGDLLIVRSHEGPRQASFDVKVIGDDRLFCAYQLWIPRPTGTAWLIPTVGEGPCIRLEQSGLRVEQEPPYLDWADRWRGIEHGAEFLSVAVQGWF